MSIKTVTDLLESKINQQLDDNNVFVDFPSDIEEVFEAATCKERKDYTGIKAFTIDSADCKDMDDAVSIEKTNNGYLLGVHIADVSAYVRPNSNLDDEALERATSIYLPGLTVPMLPGVYTNDLCSLVPNQERNTMSVFINLDENAEIVDFEICKSKIISRVKGVYKEINSIIEGCATQEIEKKYEDLHDELQLMLSLSEKLKDLRIKNGATITNNSTPIITVEDNQINVIANPRGKSEQLIEEFMIVANHVVSRFMIENNIPAIFRIQKEQGTYAEYSNLLDRHAELALNSYCHFTSPIRRYSDLMVHRYIGYFLDGYSEDEMWELFESEDPAYICDMITRRSRRANNIQIAIERFCYAEYFYWNRDKRFFGKVTGYDKYDRPLITLDDYNIVVLGDIVAERYFGKKISMNVNATEKNRLKAYRVSLAVA